MMLDQQYPMEHAFRGPAKVLDRFGSLDPAAIAAADPEEFAALCATPPAIHRFPGSMAARLQALAGDRRGDVRRRRRAALDRGRRRGQDLMRRLRRCPGFGKQKAQIFVALLAKQLGVRPEGWEQAVGAYAEDGYRSVADVVDADSLQKVRDFKKSRRRPRQPPADRPADAVGGAVDVGTSPGPWQNDRRGS